MLLTKVGELHCLHQRYSLPSNYFNYTLELIRDIQWRTHLRGNLTYTTMMRARYYRYGSECSVPSQHITNYIPRRTGIPVFPTMLSVAGSSVRTPWKFRLTVGVSAMSTVTMTMTSSTMTTATMTISWTLTLHRAASTLEST